MLIAKGLTDGLLPGEVECGDEVGETATELISRPNRAAFGLSVIRYEIGGASFSGCSRKGADDMVSPSGTTGRRGHEGAGRPSLTVG
jgi:hypothetical protein